MTRCHVPGWHLSTRRYSARPLCNGLSRLSLRRWLWRILARRLLALLHLLLLLDVLLRQLLRLLLVPLLHLLFSCVVSLLLIHSLVFLVLLLLEFLAFLVLPLLELFLLLLIFLISLGIPGVWRRGTFCRRKVPGMDWSGGTSGVVLWASSVVLCTRG